MKKAVLLCALLTLLLLPAITLTAYAHSGRTDGSGGHTDRSTGEYHYHHGYPAHDHYDMDGDGDIDCPYEFKNKTSNSSNNNSRTDSTIAESVKPDANTEDSGSSGNTLIYIIVIAVGFVAIQIVLNLGK